MLLTYLDESYSKDRYYVAGLAVHHDAVRSLENALQEVVERAVRDLDLAWGRAELHGHPLFHGEEDWDKAQPRQRIAIYGWAFDAIADHDVRIFLRGVNCKRLRERYSNPQDPHDICLQHLLERVNRYAVSTDQAALIIADELHEHDRRRSELRDFKDFGTPGYLSSRLPRIVDTIHFAPHITVGSFRPQISSRFFTTDGRSTRSPTRAQLERMRSCGIALRRASSTSGPGIPRRTKAPPLSGDGA